MNADYLTYRKATKTSLLGLIIQTGFAVALAIYARYSGGDLASMSAAIAVGIGSLVWFALVILYDQHRRERIEAMEADSLAKTESAAASAFDASNAELRPARQRLELIIKWFIPSMSILVGLLLLGIGYLRLNGGSGSALAHYGPDQFAEPRYEVFGGGVGLVIAVIGFIFARYVSGMSKDPAWSALRAGAAQAVGAALLGLLLMVSLFVLSFKGPDWPHRLLQVVIPSAMMLGGAEIFLIFILDVYRPRAPGEVLRPSFDSRILGFIAAPDKIAESVGDAINYQFGVDVTSSWFYQMLQKWAAWLLIFGVLTGWLLSMLVVVQPHQRALILTSGKESKPLLTIVGEVTDSDVGPGLHVKWPWPIGQVITPEHVHPLGENQTRTVSTTTGIQVMHMGTNPPDDDTGPILWTTQHAALEKLHVVQPGRVGNDSEMPGELSMVAVEVPVHYVIENVELYSLIAAPGQQQDLLESMGQGVVTRYVSTLSVDDVISTERSTLASRLREQIEAVYATLNDGKGAGIRIVFVGVAGVHPPRDVAPAFEGVVQAQQTRAKTIELAQGYEIMRLTEAAGSVELSQQIVSQLNAIQGMRSAGASDEDVAAAELAVQKLLERAGGTAGRLLREASSQRWTVHMNERGKAALFAGQLAAYDASPLLYRSKAYFDALGQAMKGRRVYITDNGVPVQTVIDLNDRVSGRDVFSTGTEDQ